MRRKPSYPKYRNIDYRYNAETRAALGTYTLEDRAQTFRRRNSLIIGSYQTRLQHGLASVASSWRSKVSVCTTLGLAPEPAHAHRALPAQRRDWPQPRSARAIRQATALGTPTPSYYAGRASARANPVAARLRSTSRDSSRATRLPAFLRRLHPATSRHRTREPRDHAAPFARRISTRRRLAGGARQSGGQRHSVRGAIHASVRGAISAPRVPPSSPSRYARSIHNSPATHSTPHAQHPSAHITMHAPRH
jgi:hypothetical protein